MLDVKDVSKYVYKSYKDQYRTEISAIKLQKSLYFLYAYYQMLLRHIQEGFTEISPYDICFMPKELFKFDFEAWTYGSVNVDVYNLYNTDKCFFKRSTGDLFDAYLPIVKEYVDGMLGRLFVTNDFTLVQMNRDDVSWQKAWQEGKRNKINKEDVIEEYFVEKAFWGE